MTECLIWLHLFLFSIARDKMNVSISNRTYFYCKTLPSVPDKPNCIEVRRCPDGGNCTASSKCRCPMPKRTEFWECRCPDMPSTQLHASQLGHEIIPSNADHHTVPLQRRPWSRMAVAPDVDLFHASYHVLVLVARDTPRIEACVVV